jgi:hypothetical protein
MSKVYQTQITNLNDALTNYKDAKGVKVSFTVDPNNSNHYTGTGSDSVKYHIDINLPKAGLVQVVMGEESGPISE